MVRGRGSAMFVHYGALVELSEALISRCHSLMYGTLFVEGRWAGRHGSLGTRARQSAPPCANLHAHRRPSTATQADHALLGTLSLRRA